MNKLKELWNKIISFLSPYLKIYGVFKFLTSKTFLILIVLVITVLLTRSCVNNREIRRINDIQIQNILALLDTIHVEKNKNKEQQFVIASYVTDVNNLEILNKELYNEVIAQRGEVISLNKVIYRLEQEADYFKKQINHMESIISQPVQINDTTYRITWEKRYDWDKLNYDIYRGETIVGLGKFGLRHYDSDITYRISQVDLMFGQVVENGQLRIFVKTNYPGFTPQSLQGVLIDPNTNSYIKSLIKKKKWLPNTLSIGVGPSFGYDILSTKIYLGIGVNVNYNLLPW